MTTIDPEREGEVRALLREAAAAQYVDPARAARVREAVRAEWRAGQPRRRAARTWWTAGAVAAAAIVAAVVVTRPGQRPDPMLTTRSNAPLATVRYVGGRVTGVVSGVASTTSIRAGAVLTAGAELTSDDGAAATGSGATLALADGVEVRLAGATRLRLDGPGQLELRAGSIYVDTTGRRPDRPAQRLEIRSAGAVIRDIGTRFVVSSGAATTVMVRDGRVRVERNRVPHEAGSGEQVVVSAAGDVTVSPAAAYGPAWDWIVRAAPPQPVDGRTLAEFLTWVEREGGRAIRYADPAIGAAADRTLVYGRIDGLTVDEALAVVLPSCGLTHRVDGGVITIESSDDARAGR